MNSEEPDTGSLIAPHEVRELLARLTERTTEGVRHDEPRTLAGLSLETGIPTATLRDTLTQMQGRRRHRWVWVAGTSALVLIAGAVVWRLRPAPVVTPAAPVAAPGVVDPFAMVVTGPSADLVPISEVPYGPTSNNMQADPTFHPPRPAPPGLGVSLTIGDVAWGFGDPRAEARAKPLSAQALKDFEADLTALMRYARRRAGKFGLKTQGSVDKPVYPATLCSEGYNGSRMQSVQLPVVGKDHDADADKAIEDAAGELVDETQAQLKQDDENRRQSGPS